MMSSLSLLLQALACYISSSRLSSHLYEPHYNIALASQKVHLLHYVCFQRSVEYFFSQFNYTSVTVDVKFLLVLISLD